MSKNETSIACIECGNKLLEIVYPKLVEYKENLDNFSDFEKETSNTVIGSQLALICEYYLKGLLIPNIEVVVPNELRNRIGTLTEEQELMIILSDFEKIKNDPVLNTLSRQELRTLLSNNSLKSFSHSLIALLGTESLEENKRIILPDNIRKLILTEMKRTLYNPVDQTSEDYLRTRLYLNTPTELSSVGKRIDFGDRIVEENLSLPSVDEAFPKGRYGIFDGFTSDINWLSSLMFAIRSAIKHQFYNMIEVFISKTDAFGKFIYPDKETMITIRGIDGTKMEYNVVHSLYFSAYGTEIHWDASKVVITEEELERLKVLSKYDDEAQISSQKIYLDDLEGAESIEYIENSEAKQMVLKNGELFEVSQEFIYDRKQGKVK